MLSVTGDTSYNPSAVEWSAGTDELPKGLTLVGPTLTGTPAELTAGKNFTVKAVYKAGEGQQVYTMVVAGVPFETTQVAPGGSHTCAVTPAGAVKCWGSNEFGQLGDGTTTQSSSPVAVVGLSSGIAKVFAGDKHSCALSTTGAVSCWGLNLSGQLGNNTVVSSTTPVASVGLTAGVKKLALGATNTCAITASNGLMCWGRGDSGQNGNGNYAAYRVPTAVSTLTSGVADISVGSGNACAVTSAGAVMCWGSNQYGMLGDGSSSYRPSPVTVDGFSSGAAAVSISNSTSCALTTAGGVKCWGSLTLGNSNTPVAMPGWNSNIRSVPAGQKICVATTADLVECAGMYAPYNPIPVVGMHGGVRAVSGQAGHTCGSSRWETRCWGANNFGQLGDGTQTNSESPVQILD